jgi:hypothetical protein
VARISLIWILLVLCKVSTVSIGVELPPGRTSEKFHFKEGWISFFHIPKDHLTLSQNCSNLNCQAYKAFESTKFQDLKDLDGKLTGGADPGSVVCSQRLNADIVIGTDTQGNETGFCKMKDGSMIGLGSLSFQLLSTSDKKYYVK